MKLTRVEKIEVKVLEILITLASGRDAGMSITKVISFQEKKKRKIAENLEHFQINFWEWVFAYRWRPCPQCTRLLQSCWGQDKLWSGLCGICCSYYYYYQVLYVRALKTVCQRGEKNPTFRELDEWYFQLEKMQD